MITNKKPTKIIQDAVHGIVEVEGLLMRFIDTPEFQRLRRLNQVGVTRYVYPVCTHTRFEHSLGTYHLTKRLLDAIQADLSNEVIRLTEGECTSLMLAALCHDLGHGPFSHTWERFLAQGGTQYEVFKASTFVKFLSVQLKI
uniref:HD domain-containing protein n=1 Tax=Mesocestoides corti TaxID=53468 RepID=A0A5K3EM05_MESCO